MSSTAATDSSLSQATDAVQNEEPSSEELKEILAANSNYGRALQEACEGDSEQSVENYLRKLEDIEVPCTLLIEPLAEESGSDIAPAKSVRKAVAALRVLQSIVTRLVTAIRQNKEVFSPTLSCVHAF